MVRSDKGTDRQYMEIFIMYLKKLRELHNKLTLKTYKKDIITDDNAVSQLLNNLAYLECQDLNQLEALKLLFGNKNLGKDYDIERFVGLCIYSGQIQLINNDDIKGSQIEDFLNCILRKDKEQYRIYLDKYSPILLKNGLYGLYSRGLLWCDQNINQNTVKIYINQKYMSQQEIKEQLQKLELPLINDKLTNLYQSKFEIQ